nr:unnamed protein product [Callosobruchus chinensis]
MKLILILLSTIYLCLAEEVYQNSSHICNTCNCRNEDEFVLECANKGFQHVLADWPAHEKTLVAVFSYNTISTLGRLPFSNHTVKLMLDHCNIKYLDTGILANIANVELRLNLANNGLTELVGDAVMNLTHLEELDLSSNELDFVPNTLDYLKTSLKILNLRLNLRYLYLNNLPRVKAVGPNTFATLPLLKKLEMCNNTHLRDIDREAFTPKQELVELYLNNNSLIEISYSLLQWKTLKIFEINENPLSCSCDLYNISKDLSTDITRNLDGPSCIDSSGNSRMIYHLKALGLCKNEKNDFDIDFAEDHFEMLRVTIVALSTILVVMMLILSAVAFLRYRRGVAVRNYPFTGQVSYNPLQNRPF